MAGSCRWLAQLVGIELSSSVIDSYSTSWKLQIKNAHTDCVFQREKERDKQHPNQSHIMSVNGE